MPATKTLHYPNARHLHQLYGGDEENLTRVEKALGCRLTTRDDWVKLDGPSEAVALAEEFLALLNSGKSQGIAVRTPDFIRLLDL
ncbi:MAG TPA: PhoH family protein, partial [Lacunisphaera sp.]|nr:PhoH family protein [Lacunisphaera sp.]